VDLYNNTEYFWRLLQSGEFLLAWFDRFEKLKVFLYSRGNAMVLLVEALCYKPECRGFEPNHSSRDMVLGLTQPLTEMSSRNRVWE
jgi:hypothetical protein